MKVADNKSLIFGLTMNGNMLSASRISYTNLFKTMIMEQENNEIESSAAKLPKL
jgi:hypothetical protein